jgi:hypothetical protein
MACKPTLKDKPKDFNNHGISESVINWIQVVVEVYYKEMMKKFSTSKSDTYTKYSSDYSLIHNVYMDKKYVEKFVPKNDIILKMAERWSIKFNLFGQHNVENYPIDMSANITLDDKTVNLTLNCNFNDADWRAILTNEDFLDELEDTLAYELTKLIENLNIKNNKQKPFHKGCQLNAIRQYFKTGVIDDDDYAMIYLLSCIGLSVKGEVNARVNQFFQEVERYEIENTKSFQDFWKKSIHYKIYEAMKNFKAEEVYNELIKQHGEEYLKNEIIAQWDDYARSNEELSDVRVKQKYKDNPLEFIKYWESVFKASAEYYRRKCMKSFSAHYSMIDIKHKRSEDRKKEEKNKPTTYYHHHEDYYD